MTRHRPPLPASRGFTLTELAIVLVIVALLIGGMTVALSTQREVMNNNDTQRKLADISDALLGFAAANGRLPCPAAANSNGLEQFCETIGSCAAPTTTPPSPNHGRCAVPYTGFLPAATLGIAPTDGEGFAVDAWGNRLRYAVTIASAGAILYPMTAASTATTGIKGAWPTTPFALAPDLRVCSTATGATATACATGKSLTDSAVAIVFSTGKNGGAAPTGGDELANWTSSNDQVFVSTTAADFDDIVVWVSPNALYNRLISAGRIP